MLNIALTDDIAKMTDRDLSNLLQLDLVLSSSQSSWSRIRIVIVVVESDHIYQHIQHQIVKLRYRDSIRTKHAEKNCVLKQIEDAKAIEGSGRVASSCPITADSVGQLMVSHLLEVTWSSFKAV